MLVWVEFLSRLGLTWLTPCCYLCWGQEVVSHTKTDQQQSLHNTIVCSCVFQLQKYLWRSLDIVLTIFQFQFCVLIAKYKILQNISFSYNDLFYVFFFPFFFWGGGVLIFTNFFLSLYLKTDSYQTSFFFFLFFLVGEGGGSYFYNYLLSLYLKSDIY